MRKVGIKHKILAAALAAGIVLCAKHGTNLAGESPATGFYRQV